MKKEEKKVNITEKAEPEEQGGVKLTDEELESVSAGWHRPNPYHPSVVGWHRPNPYHPSVVGWHRPGPEHDD